MVATILVLLVLAVGLVVGATIVQELLAATALRQRHARQLSQQELALRARCQLESDLRRAESVAQRGADRLRLQPGGPHAGGAAQPGSRPPADHHSRGAAPSPIWGGEVQMPCGPAFALDGAQNIGATWKNRVVLDKLQGQPALLAWMRRVVELIHGTPVSGGYWCGCCGAPGLS